MPKLYRIPALGDTVYTDQVKQTRALDIENKSVEFYLQGHKPFKQHPKPKFKYIGKKTEVRETVKKPEKLSRSVYGPLWPTETQKRKNAERMQLEAKHRAYKKQERLSRRFGWTYHEVQAIAASAFMKGMQAVMDIPEEQWDEKVKIAMEVAHKSTQEWQEYELTHD